MNERPAGVSLASCSSPDRMSVSSSDQQALACETASAGVPGGRRVRQPAPRVSPRQSTQAGARERSSGTGGRRGSVRRHPSARTIGSCRDRCAARSCRAVRHTRSHRRRRTDPAVVGRCHLGVVPAADRAERVDEFEGPHHIELRRPVAGGGDVGLDDQGITWIEIPETELIAGRGQPFGERPPSMRNELSSRSARFEAR